MSEKLKNLLNSLKPGEFFTRIKEKILFKKRNRQDGESVDFSDDDTESPPELNQDNTNTDLIPPDLPISGKTSKYKIWMDQMRDKLEPWINRGSQAFIRLLDRMHLKQKMDQTVGKIDWNQLYNLIMSPEYRIKVNQVFCLLLVAAITFSLGKIIAAAINIPMLGKKDSSRDFSLIGATSSKSSYDNNLETLKNANPFDALITLEKMIDQKDPGKKKAEVLVCRKAENQSGLPIKLMSTVVLQDSVKSVASVQVRNAEGISFREGDDIKGLARIGKIEPEKIIVKNLSTAECEYISSGSKSSLRNFNIFSADEGKKIMNKSTQSGIVNSGNNFKIAKSYRDQQLVNLSLLLTQARAIPINNPDGTISYKFTEIVPDSLYTKLGMQNGDIVHKINGSPIRSMNQVMSFFGQIKEVSHYEIEITRNGTLTNLSYDFTD